MIRLQLETCFVSSCDEFDEDLNEYQGDEDKLERAELHKLEQQLSEEQDVESQEEKDYRLEFFELLDEVSATFQTNYITYRYSISMYVLLKYFLRRIPFIYYNYIYVLCLMSKVSCKKLNLTTSIVSYYCIVKRFLLDSRQL